MSRPSEAGHYYYRDGTPCYTVNGKNTTLREARKLGLVPSVTTILNMEAKPALTAWLVNQAILSAMTLPRSDGESLDDFAVRVEEDSKQQAAKARDKGTAIHAAIQSYFETGAIDFAYGKETVAVRDWITQRYGRDGFRAESSFAHPSGYGGKADLVGFGGIVIDFKTKAFGPDKQGKDLAFPEHVTQLAAYAQGFGFETPDCVNIFISTSHPGLITVREWDQDEIIDGLGAFSDLLSLYKRRKKFDPSFNPQEVAA